MNQNLNSIIGSRAQGKSNLLKNIAFAVDPKQCELRGVKHDNFLPLDSFTLYWKDKKTNTLSIDEAKEKGILFMPQKYLGELVYEDDVKFHKFLINLFENKESFKKALESYRKFENANSLSITLLLQEVLATRTMGLEKYDKLKKLGKKEDYEKEILNIDLKIKELGKTASITSGELKKYEALNLDRNENEKYAKVIDQDILSFTDLNKGDVISAERVFELQFSEDSLSKIKSKLTESDAAFKMDFIIQEIASLRNIKSETIKKIAIIEKNIKPLQDRIGKSKALLELTGVLEKKKNIKRQIEVLRNEIDELKVSYEEKKKSLISNYVEYENKYAQIEFDLGALTYSQVRLVISFDHSSLASVIEDNINYHNSLEFKKSPKASQANNFISDSISWTYSKREFSLILRQILDGILSGELLPRASRDIGTILSVLFKNRYKIDFLKSVKNTKGNSFLEMSDGEQMLTLLEFIFKFDDYNYPILLDQPEDDLDSRAISSTIVDFLKTEKRKRQIIIASHNANLVVCGDSEEILISNKSGRSRPDFIYYSGAIENDRINKEIIEILEGGKLALKKRMSKLNIN